jgi:hypothetical protein
MKEALVKKVAQLFKGKKAEKKEEKKHGKSC